MWWIRTQHFSVTWSHSPSTRIQESKEVLKVALRSSEKDDCLVTIKTWMIYCCVTERQTRRLTASQTTKLKTFFLVLVFPRYLVFNECLSWQNKLQRRTICKKKKKLNPRSFSLFFTIFLFPFNSFVLIFFSWWILEANALCTMVHNR